MALLASSSVATKTTVLRSVPVVKAWEEFEKDNGPNYHHSHTGLSGLGFVKGLVANHVGSNSVGSCCGCAIITEDWKWQSITTNPKYIAANHSIFTGFPEGTNLDLILGATYVHMMDADLGKKEWRKTYHVLKDTTYIFYVINHTAAEAMEKLYSPEFLKAYDVKGHDFEGFSVLWSEKKP